MHAWSSRVGDDANMTVFEKGKYRKLSRCFAQVEGERWSGNSREMIESEKVFINFSLFFKDTHFSMSVH